MHAVQAQGLNRMRGQFVQKRGRSGMSPEAP
jgi:hypothetical protein